MALAAFFGMLALMIAAVAIPVRHVESYRDKTADEWMQILSSSQNVRLRMQAAEAIGFLAREDSMTYGGFLDIPIDSEPPPPIADGQLRAIVAALVDGLEDPCSQVRASSAIALSWIGPRAQRATPALVRCLDDPSTDVRNSTLTAIGRIGPAAREVIPRMKSLLATSRADNRVEIATALRLVDASPEFFVSSLIAQLGRDDSSPSSGYYAALELAELGDAAVPALLVSLRDANPVKRKNAAYALSNMASGEKPIANREQVAIALVGLTRDADRDVKWHAVQALGSVHAAPDQTVPALVALMNDPETDLPQMAAESLGEFGPAAILALPVLIDQLARRPDVYTIARAIREIGIDRTSAEAIARCEVAEEGSWLLVPLLAYPDAATEFVRRNPHVIDVPARDRAALLDLLRTPSPPLQPLSDLLIENEFLSPVILAELGSPRYLPLIERKINESSSHAKTQWMACARACGAPADRIVNISAAKPGDFKPRSAWPDTDSTRKSPHSYGHGDGYTEVIVTGQLLRDDGDPVTSPRFFRTNDAMLLGQRIREQEPIVYDSKTGRFVYTTSVFAAYSTGEAQPEPGPYQTGSSLVEVVAPGCEPLVVQFYDEMPEVRIVLTSRTRK
jgi:HEAT repeat protein